MQNWLTVEEAARLLQITTDTLRRYIRGKRITPDMYKKSPVNGAYIFDPYKLFQKNKTTTK